MLSFPHYPEVWLQTFKPTNSGEAQLWKIQLMPLIKGGPWQPHFYWAAPWIDTRMAGLLKRRETEQTNAKSILGLADVTNFWRLIDIRRDRTWTPHWLIAALTPTPRQPHLNVFSPMEREWPGSWMKELVPMLRFPKNYPIHSSQKSPPLVDRQRCSLLGV